MSSPLDPAWCLKTPEMAKVTSNLWTGTASWYLLIDTSHPTSNVMCSLFWNLTDSLGIVSIPRRQRWVFLSNDGFIFWFYLLFQHVMVFVITFKAYFRWNLSVVYFFPLQTFYTVTSLVFDVWILFGYLFCLPFIKLHCRVFLLLLQPICLVSAMWCFVVILKKPNAVVIQSMSDL